MARPRRKARDYMPALLNQAAVTLADMGAQTIDQTLTANSAGHINTILNSLRTTDVFFHFYPTGGQSYHITPVEVTDPTVSAIFVHLRSDTPGPPANAGLSLRMKGFIIQGG